MWFYLIYLEEKMKKIFVCFAVLAGMFFFAACSGGSKETVYDDTDSGSQSGEKNDSDDGGSATDTVPDDADSQGDTTPDNGDSQHEGTDSSDSVDDSGNTVPDNSEPSDPTDDTDTSDPTDDTDSSDSVSDDDSDSTHENDIEIGDTREADCTDLPANASWNTVSSITQTWNGTEWVPSTDATFSTTESTTKCRFVCNQNYSWNDSECVAETRTANCEGLPENAVWNSAASITQTWDDENWIPSSTGTYNQNSSTTECRFKCAQNYNWTGSQCVAATNQVECTGLPENALWNTVSDITQTWSGTAWVPTNAGSFNETPSYSECRFVCKTNYTWNGVACAPDEMNAVACSGKPENAVWNTVSNITQTWNGTEWVPTTSSIFSETPSTTQCFFKCADNYEWNNSQCVAKSREVNCTGLPTNAQWNTATKIMQTWDGNAWIPTNIGSFNTSASSSECYFKCNEHYTWNNTICAADQQPAICTGLPANAQWNSVSEITQTWNGNGWTPSTIGTYNTSASTTECRFKCNENYNWDSSTSTCIAATKPASCTGLPTNASWNTASSITQTWDGNAWFPSNAGTYNTTASSTECRFKCNAHYSWKNSQCVADQQDVNCTGLPTNASWNTASSITQTWNGNAWAPSNAGTYNETASSTECRYKCNIDYHWENSACVSNTKNNVACTGLPSNAQWNTASSITQTWNGTSWTPSTTGTYNTTASTTECRYKCSNDYHWENSQCVSNTKTNVACTGLPSNAVWNTASSITQTWNGTSWAPSTTGVYNETASNTECRYKCSSSYHRENSQCISNTKTNVACTGLPTNAQWNTVSTITQNWNGSSYTPSTTGVFNTTASTSECRFKCKTNYTWTNNTTCKANQKVSNCTGLPANAVWNTASTISQTWNGNDWAPTTTGVYSTTASTSECRYKCKEGSAWNGSQCIVSLGRICTGINKCYDESGEELDPCPSSPSFTLFGQDACYANLGKCTPKSFTVQTISNQKVVVDNNTGLMWLQKIPTDTYKWGAAVSYCNNLSYAGYSDWRLASPQELWTIMDYGVKNYYVDTTYFPTNAGYNFWTSYAFSYPDYNNLALEFEGSMLRDLEKTNAIHLRCVRGNELAKSTFSTSTVNNNVIVTDTKTGLIWQKTYVTKTWLEALEYCENLTYAGYKDWRLPNLNELASLVNHERYQPASDFPGMPNDKTFWSSSGVGTGGKYISFEFGTSNTQNKTKTSYVRCVRN